MTTDDKRRPYLPVVLDVTDDGRIGLTASSRLGDGIRVRLTTDEALALRSDLLRVVTDVEIQRVTTEKGS